MAANDSVPLYDLDELLAGLSLEDETSTSCFSTRSPHLAPSSLPSISVPPPPAPKTPSCPPWRSSATVYAFTTPAESGTTTQWSEAGTLTQGSPQSSVRLLYKRKRSRPKRVAYVVFHGVRIGVFDQWADVQDATNGVPFALHQGYSTRAGAEAAFELAQTNNWTCVLASWFPKLISSSLAPTPVRHESGGDQRLCEREPDAPWYVVYRGVNPGIFSTQYVECQLNVLGISGAVYESVPTYAEARRKLAHTRERGDVSVRRTRQLMDV
ncbi:hypothetical protein B0H12DRAFT_1244119 [Mycena haematopus]|nr:hypothetical protein B0H12DRAFT_1244119 [Mycena haematopus]